MYPTDHQARAGKLPVGTPSEPVQHAFLAGRIYLEYGSASAKPAVPAYTPGDPALLGCTVEVTRRVLNQTCYWNRAIRRAGKSVQQSKSLRLRRWGRHDCWQRNDC